MEDFRMKPPIAVIAVVTGLEIRLDIQPAGNMFCVDRDLPFQAPVPEELRLLRQARRMGAAHLVDVRDG